MPIYEYRCLKCKNEFETLVLGERDTVTCPECKGKDMERLMSVCGFKGNGGPGDDSFSSSLGSSGCASCSGGNCSTCR